MLHQSLQYEYYISTPDYYLGDWPVSHCSADNIKMRQWKKKKNRECGVRRQIFIAIPESEELIRLDLYFKISNVCTGTV